MKILVNDKIKALFFKISICTLIFAILTIIILKVFTINILIYIPLCFLCLAIAILVICYQYLKEQNKIIENATVQISEYIAGNRNARIECNAEGELYRLFHEINSLVTILSAHAENEARTKELLKSTIADISHQLKTPLAALNIYNGILQGDAQNPDTIKEITKLSEQELDRIELLVQNLLKMAKFDAGVVIMNKNEEKISKMIENIEHHFSYRAKNEGKTIVLSGSDNVTLLCDRNWIIEAISNIVKNALDHTKCNDEILIEWKMFANVIQIKIKDNGCGIHPEDIYHIFKRFYRSRFSKDTQGVGLGLPLAKSIIEAHNGTIEVESELDIGTTFTINFLIPTKL